MKIDTEDIIKSGKYAVAGSALSLVLAIWIPAVVLLVIEALAIGALATYSKTTGEKFKLFGEKHVMEEN